MLKQKYYISLFYLKRLKVLILEPGALRFLGYRVIYQGYLLTPCQVENDTTFVNTQFCVILLNKNIKFIFIYKVKY